MNAPATHGSKAFLIDSDGDARPLTAHTLLETIPGSRSSRPWSEIGYQNDGRHVICANYTGVTILRNGRTIPLAVGKPEILLNQDRILFRSGDSLPAHTYQYQRGAVSV